MRGPRSVLCIEGPSQIRWGQTEEERRDREEKEEIAMMAVGQSRVGTGAMSTVRRVGSERVRGWIGGA